MINIDNIGNLMECRIWLEDFPSAESNVSEVLCTALETSDCLRGRNRSIAVELFVAPRYYALLGIEYTYKCTSSIEILVNIVSDTEKLVADSLALSSDNVHSGISKEYAQTILNTSKKVLMDLKNIPSGILTFNVGGYGDYGSNQVIFSKATSILMRLFIGMQNNIELEGLQNIVRIELKKPLADV